MILPGPFTASRIHFAASAAAAPCCDLSTAGPDFPLRIGALNYCHQWHARQVLCYYPYGHADIFIRETF